LQVGFLPGQGPGLLSLLLQRLQPLLEATDTRFGLAFFQVALSVAVDQARNAVAHLRNLLFQ
jgi:hypothetical protein